jgi:hypothetical protein
MKYALLIYADETDVGLALSKPNAPNLRAEHTAFSAELGHRRLDGSGLQRTATASTVRTAAGGAKSVHDGPFAETKEQLAGFYLIEARDLDEAIAIAKRVPMPVEGSVEIRPVLGPG